MDSAQVSRETTIGKSGEQSATSRLRRADIILALALTQKKADKQRSAARPTANLEPFRV
jgi:hypothetical protein